MKYSVGASVKRFGDLGVGEMVTVDHKFNNCSELSCVVIDSLAHFVSLFGPECIHPFPLRCSSPCLNDEERFLQTKNCVISIVYYLVFCLKK